MRPIFNLSKVQILVKNRLKGKIFSRQNETSLLRVLAIEEIAIFRYFGIFDDFLATFQNIIW